MRWQCIKINFLEDNNDNHCSEMLLQQLIHFAGSLTNISADSMSVGTSSIEEARRPLIFIRITLIDGCLTTTFVCN